MAVAVQTIERGRAPALRSALTSRERVRAQERPAALPALTGLRCVAALWVLLPPLLAPAPPAAVVALGDSITWGYQGTTHAMPHPWPAVLAARAQIPVYNAGIAGNAVDAQVCALCGAAAPERLHADVLARPGVRIVIVLLGINDTWRGYPPAQTMAGLALIARRLHAHGLRVIAGTLLPYGGSRVWTPAGERARARINAWIRTSATFDGVVDFARVLSDPRDPARLRARYDCGDGLHPSVAGQRAMGRSIPLAVLWGTR